MSRPSDGMTFDELRDEFDWMFEFQSRMAERIRDDADVHNLADYVTKLETENAKLRESAALQSAVFKYQTENAKLQELAALQSVIFKHMSTCPTTDCQACPVNEECAESVHLEGLLGIDDKETSWLVQWRSEDAADVRAENAKLRKLVADMMQAWWACDDERCPRHDERCESNKWCAFDESVKELGIEAN